MTTNLQARDLMRDGELAHASFDPKLNTTNLLDWAYLGEDLPRVLEQLKDLALPERWEFMNQVKDPKRPYPILYSYLVQTFARLVLEKKVITALDGQYAAFNTGLVDLRYETIYALFERNVGHKSPWKLTGFCTAGEGLGKILVRYFCSLPEPAHYFDEPLYYDKRQGSPELDWNHIIIDRIDRYPVKFLEDNCPREFGLKDPREFRDDKLGREQYAKSLGKAILSDDRTYRRIINRFKDAVDLSIKRIAWNYKAAVIQYYPKVGYLQLLIPLSLVDDNHVDLALVVERTPAGNYLGHTVLPLDGAYRNARLICRPDSDWLEPTAIEPLDESELE